jgi:mitogen-activated protein kinase 1/3
MAPLRAACLAADTPGIHSPKSPKFVSKRLRNLRKKLREIESLEKRSSRSWTCDVRQKLERKPLLEAEISRLEWLTVELSKSSSIQKTTLALKTFDDKDANQRDVVTPSVWEKATATPQDSERYCSVRSSCECDCDRTVASQESEKLQAREDGATNHPTMQTVESHGCGEPRLRAVEVTGKESTTFRVPLHLEYQKVLGSGAYGTVAAFWDHDRQERVAVKKVSDAFKDVSCGMRTLREVRVLDSVHHPNLVKMHYCYTDKGDNYDDVYIAQECMDYDLHTVLRKVGKTLNDAHHKHILYGIVCGLRHLHGMDVAHRDLKPSNILLMPNCSAKICDFNLSRGGMHSETASAKNRVESECAELSDYVCTRWYRAPEVMLFKERYGKQIDIWSLGCIACEFFCLKPIFKGSSSSDQVRQIIGVIGAPLVEDVQGRAFRSRSVAKLLNSLVSQTAQPLSSLLPGASSEAVDMIGHMLKFNPDKRITAHATLHDEYFRMFWRSFDERHAPAPEKMDWSFDEPPSTESRLRELFCAGMPPKPASVDHAALAESMR